MVRKKKTFSLDMTNDLIANTQLLMCEEKKQHIAALVTTLKLVS